MDNINSNTNAPAANGGFNLAVRIRPVEDMGKLKASASLTFSTPELGSFFVINGVRVVEGKNGLLVGMPSSKGKDGDFHDICFPITSSFRQMVNETVLGAYRHSVAERGADKDASIVAETAGSINADRGADRGAEKPSILNALRESAQEARANATQAQARAYDAAKRKPGMAL